MTFKKKVILPNALNKFLISFLGILVIVLSIATSFLAYDKYTSVRNSKNVDIQSLSEIRSIVQDNYLDSLPTDEEFQKGQLKGFIASLKDPYSEYLAKMDSEKFNDSLNQRYEGVGIRFNQEEKDIVVDKVFRGSPAEKGGVTKGDVLKLVDSLDVTNLKVSDVADKIRGPKGSNVKLTVVRNNQTLEYNIIRDKVITDLIYLEFEGDTAIIEISSFGENLNSKMENITKEINSKSEIKNIIVDLRGNSGGLLDEAVSVISYFVEPNSIALYEKDKKTEEAIRTTSKNPNLINYKLAVLVDGNSASASEIMAGSLRDLKQAKLFGEKTYGKGVVQRLFDLNNGDELKLTIAEWLTPNKTEINKQGIKPDVETGKDDPRKIALQSFKI